ncbi:MAG: Ni/Fe-hydrogenase, b-type cytochrome subunit [Bacillota bacterium]
MGQGILYHTATARILHWINTLSVVMLTLTGFYIHWPLKFSLFSGMDSARKLHFIFMYVVVYGIVIRVYYAWVSGDYRDIMFRPADIRGLPALARYYFFMTKSLPDFGKYNPGQKLTYTGWTLLIIVQAVTGFILYWPTRLAWLAEPLGGMMMMRQVHYLVTWIFVATVGLHVYLGFLGGPAVLKSIITGYMSAGAHMQPDSGEAGTDRLMTLRS